MDPQFPPPPRILPGSHFVICTALSVVDGGWSDWTTWTSRTVSCGSGTRERSRKCDNPAPANGGESCIGDYDEAESCNKDPCPSKHLSN